MRPAIKRERDERAGRPEKTRAVGWMLLVASAALAGLLAQGAGLPAGWLVGPMLVAIVAALLWPEHPTMPR